MARKFEQNIYVAICEQSNSVGVLHLYGFMIYHVSEELFVA